VVRDVAQILLESVELQPGAKTNANGSSSHDSRTE